MKNHLKILTRRFIVSTFVALATLNLCDVTAADHRHYGHSRHGRSNEGAPVVSSQQQSHGMEHRCERIRIPLCLDTPYNFTRMPNLFDHPDQHAAAVSIAEYNILVNAQCSENLKFFLCSIYAPMCTETVDVPVTSCRSVCLKVHSKCMPLFESVGLAWPDALNCSKFPEAGRGTLCMDPESSAAATAGPSAGSMSTAASVMPRAFLDSGRTPDGQLRSNAGDGPVSINDPFSFNRATGSAVAQCARELLSPVDDAGRCGLPCHSDFMFDQPSKKFAARWTAAWSSLCYLATWFTLVTFWLDHSRFPYPERPVVCLSFCYNCYSFGYLLRFFMQPETIKCHRWPHTPLSVGEPGVHSDGDVPSAPLMLITGGVDNSYCVAVFTILYYFSTASVIWWVVLSFSWYLAAVRQWGAEAIANISQYFHLVAWGVPALLTIAVMVTRSVDASELTGLCYVGQHNSNALIGFLIAPLSIFLIIGIGFITAGLLAMSNIRKQMRLQERSIDLIKFEKLMARIAIFSILYGIPTAVVICCYAYEYAYVQAWSPFISANDHQCHHNRRTFPPTLSQNTAAGNGEQLLQQLLANHKNLNKFMDFSDGRLQKLFSNDRGASNDFSSTDPADPTHPRATTGACQALHQIRPTAEVYMLKIFMSLIVGITSAMWVLSKKTFWAWRSACLCCFRLQKHSPAIHSGRKGGDRPHFPRSPVQHLPLVANGGPALPLLGATPACQVRDNSSSIRSSSGVYANDAAARYTGSPTKHHGDSANCNRAKCGNRRVSRGRRPVGSQVSAAV